MSTRCIETVFLSFFPIFKHREGIRGLFEFHGRHFRSVSYVERFNWHPHRQPRIYLDWFQFIHSSTSVNILNMTGFLVGRPEFPWLMDFEFRWEPEVQKISVLCRTLYASKGFLSFKKWRENVHWFFPLPFPSGSFTSFSGTSCYLILLWGFPRLIPGLGPGNGFGSLLEGVVDGSVLSLDGTRPLTTHRV